MQKMKLRNTALDILIRIEKESGYSHLLIQDMIMKNQLSNQDERLLVEIVYGTTERRLTLDYYLEPFIQSKKKLDDWVLTLLRMSLYQLQFLDRVPPHAVIHEAVEIAKERRHQGVAGFVNGVLRNIQRKGVRDLSEIKDEVLRLSVETSHPKWLVKRWIDQYGLAVTREICEANLSKKPLSVRLQRLNINQEEAITQLESENVKVTPSSIVKHGIIVEEGNLIKTRFLKDGYGTIQDQSSMLASELVGVTEGITVLDSCSAPGGKATHLAEIMENNGHIFAYDLYKKKVNLIKQNAIRLGLDIIEASHVDARKLQSIHEKEQFDRILVDAPCSGFGVIRSKPDIKYTKTEIDVERLSEIQLNILEHVSPLLKKEGRLVYCTCTINKTENEDIIKRFLRNNDNFEIDEQFFNQLPEQLASKAGVTQYGLQIFPQTLNSDGFFISRLKRKND